MSVLGITPDLTLYSATAKDILEQLHKVLISLEENWSLERDDYGKLVNARPYWVATYKDGSSSLLNTSTEPNEATVGTYNPKTSAARDTQNLINKYFDYLKGGVAVEYCMVKDSEGNVEAILPRRTFTFKTSNEIAEEIADKVHKEVINAS